MCFTRMYRQNNVLLDVFKNAPIIVASQLLACGTSWKNVFLDVGRCRSKDICLFFFLSVPAGGLVLHDGGRSLILVRAAREWENEKSDQ